MKIIDDNSKKENLTKIQNILNKANMKADIISHNNKIHKNIIKKQANEQTFSNLSSLLKCFEIGKLESKDLIFFRAIAFSPLSNKLAISRALVELF